MGLIVKRALNPLILTISDLRSAISDQRSAICDQRSAICDQRSAISDKRSAISDGLTDGGCEILPANGLQVSRAMAHRLTAALRPEAVMVPCRWDSFEDTVRGLVAALGDADISDEIKQDAVRLICQRESISSTAMVDIGVSIPHARVRGVNGIVAALAANPEGVYQRGDGLPISIVVLVLTSPELSGEYLNFLSSLSLLLQSSNIRQQLKEALSAREVLLLLQEHEPG